MNGGVIFLLGMASAVVILWLSILLLLFIFPDDRDKNGQYTRWEKIENKK